MSYQIEVRHDGLHKYRLIRGSHPYVVQQKAEAQVAAWDQMWAKRQAAEAKKSEREQFARERDAKKELAIERTREAEEAIRQLERTLVHTLGIDDTIDWERLKDRSPFETSKPTKPRMKKVAAAPERASYTVELGFLDKLIRSRREKKIAAASAKFERDYEAWEKHKRRVAREFETASREHDVALAAWRGEEDEFRKAQEEAAAAIDARRDQYLQGDPGAIADYCDMVLSNSEYPDYFPQEFELDYNPETKILLVDYSLPPLTSLPTTKAVKYVQSRDELTESSISDAQLNKLYDSLLYQIVLRTIHELYEADVVNALASIVFNGWVRSTDPGTGQEVNACVLSVQASRDEFLAINLANVDPKVCFKNLKGVGSSKLHSLTPIAPIMKIDREDARFVSSYEVAASLDDSYNLAAMDWQDFEHLIRELFEKEFSEGGGEVKVTQASRDGGVDAIAFDPDPIRGGKIVIQAKRYTKVVGVAAVRDLYGTVVNEGATKGILITTADYGPDAYEFARSKPLTLLNGSNLLHLLEKHGHKAKIDLVEARQLWAERGADA